LIYLVRPPNLDQKQPAAMARINASD